MPYPRDPRKRNRKLGTGRPDREPARPYDVPWTGAKPWWEQLVGAVLVHRIDSTRKSEQEVKKHLREAEGPRKKDADKDG